MGNHLGDAPLEILRDVLQFIRREQVRVCAGKAEWILNSDCHAIYLQTEDGLYKKDGAPWDYPYQKIVSRFPELRIKVAYSVESDAGLWHGLRRVRGQQALCHQWQEWGQAMGI